MEASKVLSNGWKIDESMDSSAWENSIEYNKKKAQIKRQKKRANANKNKKK